MIHRCAVVETLIPDNQVTDVSLIPAYTESPLPAPVTSSLSVDSPLSLSKTLLLFHSRLKSHVLDKFSRTPHYLFVLMTAFTDNYLGRYVLSKSFFLFLVLYLISSVRGSVR